MSLEPVLLVRAQQELLESWSWYEDKQTGLGDKFKNEVFETIDYLTRYPEHYPHRKRPYRDAPLKIFPYVVIYRVLKKENLLVVSSIFHASRNPKRKYKS